MSSCEWPSQGFCLFPSPKSPKVGTISDLFCHPSLPSTGPSTKHVPKEHVLNDGRHETAEVREGVCWPMEGTRLDEAVVTQGPPASWTPRAGSRSRHPQWNISSDDIKRMGHLLETDQHNFGRKFETFPF